MYKKISPSYTVNFLGFVFLMCWASVSVIPSWLLRILSASAKYQLPKPLDFPVLAALLVLN